MINSQIPDSVNLFCDDCKIAIVISAIYEYGGFTRFDLDDFFSDSEVFEFNFSKSNLSASSSGDIGESLS
jgi:hypothetical protein